MALSNDLVSCLACEKYLLIIIISPSASICHVVARLHCKRTHTLNTHLCTHAHTHALSLKGERQREREKIFSRLHAPVQSLVWGSVSRP